MLSTIGFELRASDAIHYRFCLFTDLATISKCAMMITTNVLALLSELFCHKRSNTLKAKEAVGAANETVMKKSNH